MSAQPYTHADHAKACQQAAKRREVLAAWVQVRTNGSANCARLLEPWSTADGVDFWKVAAVAPMRFTGSFPVRAVRQCSGLDGRCLCAGETGEACEAGSTGRAKLAPHVPGELAQHHTPQGVTCV